MVRQAVFCDDDSLGDRADRGGVLLGLRCDARDFRLYSVGLKMGGFQLSVDGAECSFLAAFQPGWGHECAAIPIL